MFYPEKMSRATVASPKAYLKQVIDTLYNLRALHLEEYVPRKQGDLPIGAPLKDAEKISELLLEIHALKKLFPQAAVKKNVKMSLAQAAAFLRKLRNRADSLNSRIRELSGATAGNRVVAEQLEFLSRCGLSDPRVLGQYKTLGTVSGYFNPAYARTFEKEGLLFAGTGKKQAPFVLFFSKEKKGKIDELLKKAKFSEYKLTYSAGKNIGQALSEAKRKATALEQQKAGAEQELQKLGSDNMKLVNGLEENLLSLIQKNEAPLRFAASNHVFIVQGWVPEKNTNLLLENISEISPNIFVKVEPAKKDAPTKIENPPPVKSFEFFLNLYSLPRYNEIDPSFLIFITFPVFYGMMLGDIGYGLVILALAFFIKYRMKKMGALMDITILSALSTIAFGYIFGEAFGAEEFLGIHLKPIIHRLESVNELIIISALLGLVHVNAGIILGFINELKTHGFVKAATAKLSWIVFQAGFILAGLVLLGYANMSIYIPAALIVLAIAGLFKGEGIVGIVEIPGIIANVLSYLRLAAIGLASASLAVVVNKMASPLFASGGAFGFAFGVAVLVIGHSINLALGILDAFLQSLRLHYVEMFTKFYHGAGKPYRPFGEKK